MISPTETELRSMPYTEFSRWIKIKKDDRIDNLCCWQDLFASEIKGYSSTIERPQKPCCIWFRYDNGRQHDLESAIAYAKSAYAERAQRLEKQGIKKVVNAAVAMGYFGSVR